MLKVLQDREEDKEDKVLKVLQEMEEDKEDKVLKVILDQQDQQDLQELHVTVSPWIRELVFPKLVIPQVQFRCIQQFQVINRIISTIGLLPIVRIQI